MKTPTKEQRQRWSSTYYQKHKKEIDAKTAQYQRDNPEIIAARNRRWRDKNPDKALEISYRWKAKNKESVSISDSKAKQKSNKGYMDRYMRREPWTLERDHRIIELKKAGLTHKETGKTVDRSTSSITARLFVLNKKGKSHE
tara:strand:- start:76 stop:501 length:426 start_codon:yes stop_codon:yes gene_type:complete